MGIVLAAELLELIHIGSDPFTKSLIMEIRFFWDNAYHLEANVKLTNNEKAQDIQM